MSIKDLGTVRPGSTIYIEFDSFGASGESLTLTGLAASDVEVYKNGGTTQRASDAGYTLLDTDGIDFDGLTGIHGLSIDLADNTTAGFWEAGAHYRVVISSVTINSQTVSFTAATFRIGYAAAVLNTTIATLSSQTSFTLTAGPAEDDALNGMWAVIHDVASAVQFSKVLILDYTGSTKTVTLAAGATFTAAASDNFSVIDLAPLQPTTTGRTLDVSTGGEAGIDWANVGSQSTSVNLSGTTTNLVNTVTTYTGNTPQTGDSYAIVNSGTHGNAALKTLIDAVDDYVDTEIGALTTELAKVPKSDSNVTWNATALASIQSEANDALVAYDPPTKAELDAAVANVSVDEIQATALADLFNTDSGTTYASAIAGSVVKEIADNAGGASLTLADIADAVWDEATAGHTTAGTFGEQLKTDVDAILADTNELQTDWVDGGRLDLILDARASQTSVDAIDDYVDTEIASLATELAKVPKSDGSVTWNATALASIQSEANDALVANNLDHLLLSAVDTNFATTVHLDSVIGHLADNGTTASFNRTTDSLEAADADRVVIETSMNAVITALFDGSLVVGSLSTGAKAEVEAEATDALTAYGASTLDAAGVRTALGMASADLDSQLDAILADTNELQGDWANGGRLDLIIDATLADTNELQGDWVDGGRLDLILDARATPAQVATELATYDGPTNAEMVARTLAAASYATAAAQTTAQADLDILTGTDGVTLATSQSNYAPATAAALASLVTTVGAAGAGLTEAGGDGDHLTALATQASVDAVPTAAENAAGLLDLAAGVETGLTLRQALRLLAAASAGKLSGAATTTITIRNAVADDKNRITATVDADGNRSAITVDLT